MTQSERSVRPSLVCASRIASRSAWAVQSIFRTTPARTETDDFVATHDNGAVRLIACAFRELLHLESLVDKDLRTCVTCDRVV